MKKIIIIIGIVLLLVVSLIGYKLYNNYKNYKPTTNLQTITYILEGEKYHLLVADSPGEWAKGLMDVRKLDNADGMIFKFPTKREVTFWNKNTFVDLQLYWLNDDKLISKTELPSIKKSKDLIYVSSPGPVNRVIEIIKR